jgi:hypothetical protein
VAVADLDLDRVKAAVDYFVEALEDIVDLGLGSLPPGVEAVAVVAVGVNVARFDNMVNR